MSWPRPPLFSLCGFRLDHHLGSRPAHSSHHTPGGSSTHLSHFWVAACYMFCGAAERNNVACRNSRFLSLNVQCRGRFLLRPLPSLMLDHIPWNHNVIYTRPSPLNHLAGVIPLHNLILFCLSDLAPVSIWTHIYDVWYCVLLNSIQGVNYVEYIIVVI